MVERRLGRGLDFFLTDRPQDDGGNNTPNSVSSQSVDPSEAIQQLDIAKLIPNPDQPRRDFHEKEIAELAESIRASGLLQPILARKRSDSYQIIAGERRWRAAKSIGLERVPVVVREVNDEQVAVIGLVENLHRADLNPVEKARAFRKIQQLTKCGTEEVGRKVGLDRSTVANFMRLLELPSEVLAHVSRGTISMGHARSLLALSGSDAQRQAAEEVIRAKLSVRQVEELVQRLKQTGSAPQVDAKGKPKARKPSQEAWVKECEDNLTSTLGAGVTVRYSRRKAKIVIETSGREEFERVYGKLIRGEGE